MTGYSTPSGAPGYITHAFLWTPGATDGVPTNPEMKDLGTLPGGLYSRATVMNNSGQVAGYSRLMEDDEEKQHNFIWDSVNGMQDLGLSAAYCRSYAFDMNNYGQVVGFAYPPWEPHPHRACLWNGVDDMQDLGNTIGGDWSVALGINNLGQVVGHAYPGTGSYYHAFIWDSVDGMQDLNDLIPADSGWELMSAAALNDVGQIVGSGLLNDSSYTRAFLLTPVTHVDIDIKPGSCPNPLNSKSGGVLPVAIVGTEDFEVYDIDSESIALEGIAPIRYEYEDVATPCDAELCDCHVLGPDGVEDLTLKFDTQDMVAALGPVNEGDKVVLTLTGALLDGTPIEGQDCVVIISKQ